MFNKKWTIESDDDIFNVPEKKSGFGGLFAKKSSPETERVAEPIDEAETEDVEINDGVEDETLEETVKEIVEIAEETSPGPNVPVDKDLAPEGDQEEIQQEVANNAEDTDITDKKKRKSVGIFQMFQKPKDISGVVSEEDTQTNTSEEETESNTVSIINDELTKLPALKEVPDKEDAKPIKNSIFQRLKKPSNNIYKLADVLPEDILEPDHLGVPEKKQKSTGEISQQAKDISKEKMNSKKTSEDNIKPSKKVVFQKAKDLESSLGESIKEPSELASTDWLFQTEEPIEEELNINSQESIEPSENAADEDNIETIEEPEHKRRIEVLNTPDDVTEKPIKKGIFKRFQKGKEQELIEDAGDSVVYIPEKPKKKRKKKKAEEESTPKEVDRTQYLDAMEWFEMLSLTSIPVIGFIILIFMSFWPVKSGKGIDRRGYARGKLLQSIFIYGILIGLLYFGYLKLYPYAMDFLDKLEAL